MPITSTRLLRLVIRNFQKHHKLTVNFDPYITVLVGRSDAGKSSILRALKFICLNKIPDRLINKDAEVVKVILKTDKSVIKRVKGPKANTYSLNDSLYKAFGTSVPPAIAAELNVTEQNWQDQFDAPFWFFLTPGQVSKQLNQIVNLEAIDQTLANIASRVRKTKSEVQITKDRLKAARREKESLSWVKKANTVYSQVERLTARVTQLNNSRATLAGLVSEAKQYHQAGVVSRQRLAEAENKANLMVGDIKQLADVTWRVERLQDLVRDIKQAEKDKCQNLAVTTTLEQELKKVQKCPVCKQPIKF